MSILKNTQSGTNKPLTLETVNMNGYVFLKGDGSYIEFKSNTEHEDLPLFFKAYSVKYRRVAFDVQMKDGINPQFIININLNIDDDGATGSWTGIIKTLEDLNLVERMMSIECKMRTTSKILKQLYKDARYSVINNIKTQSSIVQYSC